MIAEQGLRLEAALAAMHERDRQYELREAQARHEAERREQERDRHQRERIAVFERESMETRTEIRSLRRTVVVTAISSTLATVLGVASFNAALLSNMQASYDSGRGTGGLLAQMQQQISNTQQQIKEIQVQVKDMQVSIKDIQNRLPPAPPKKQKAQP